MTQGRGLRIFLFTTVIGLVLVGAADRIAVWAVADQIATRAQSAEDLAERPEVSLGGFPFLTQVAAGRYQDVTIEVRGFAQDGARIDRVRAELVGVRLPLSDVIRQDVDRVPVDRVDAEVDLTFDDVNAYLLAQGSQVQVGAAGQGIEVGGTVNILGVDYPMSGTADIGIAPEAVTFTPRELTAGLSAVLPPDLVETARSLLTVQVPVTGLPFNMSLRSATVAGDRLMFEAGGENVVLETSGIPGGVPEL